jgi:pimeloyl-ACP methyl ester carboxylesterase
MMIDNEGVSLHVTDEGRPDGPPVLFLHGITSCVHTWDWVLPHLADRYRVLRLDFRGHGESGRAEGSYQFADYITDAAAVCRQLVGGPAVVVGHSLGGGTAAALAQQHPELVTAAFMEDPALMAAVDVVDGDALEGNALGDVFALMRQTVPVMQAQGMSPTELAAMLAGMPGTTGVPMGEALHPDAMEAMASGLLHLDVRVLDPVLDGSMRPAYDPDQPIPVPSLVLAADPASPDAVVRAPQVQRLAANSPHTEVRVMPGASHLIHDELGQRDAYLAALLNFLREAEHVVG